jgi:hypothetical protein
LGKIGDARAVEPLIKALNVIDEIEFIREYRVWRPYWEPLEVFTAVAKALGKIGDVRAAGPLANALENEKLWMELGNDILYHGFFTIPIVEAMIKIGMDTITDENERSLAGAHLKLMLEIGSNERTAWFREMYATSFGDYFYDHFDGERIAELICEIGPAYCSHWRIDSCSGFIRDALWKSPDEPFCKELIQNLENRTQLLIRIIGESRGIYSKTAAEALDRQGWQPDTDELRANYLIATEQWNKCSSLGASAVKTLVRALGYELAELRSRRSADKEWSWMLGEDKITLEPIARVLGEIGDKRAVKPLLEALRDGEEYVRNEAKEALKKLGHKV